MNNNILVLGSGRCGSSFLCAVLNNGGMEVVKEFFGVSLSHIQSIHLPILLEYYQHSFVEGVLGYNKLLQTLSSYESEELSRIFKNKAVIAKNDIDINCFKNYKKFKNDPDFLVKIFHSHINGVTNNIDVKELIPLFDKYIILYRKNFLRQYISFEKANAINVWNWRPNDSENDRYKNLKIEWKLNRFNNLVKRRTEAWLIFYEAIKDLPNPKAIICYEDFAYKDDPQQYIQEVLDENGFDHTVNRKFIRGQQKQADESIPIEDNFSNKEDFLKDYDSIKEMVDCKIFDDVTL